MSRHAGESNILLKRRSAGFTLVELLVVIGLLTVLITIVVSVSARVISSGRARHTRAVMQTLQLAIEQFQTEAPLAKVPYYNSRYVNNAPPDELEVFDQGTTRVHYNPRFSVNLAPGAAEIIYPEINANLGKLHYRDTKAMTLAIKLYSPAGAEILDRVDDRFRRSPISDYRGHPQFGSWPTDGEYLDQPDTGTGAAVQIPLDYFVDSWGTPLQYYATFLPESAGGGMAVQKPTSKYDVGGARQKVSTMLVQMNNRSPVLVSYGPDGRSQFPTPTAEQPYPPPDPVDDLTSDYADDQLINMPANQDNVYSNSALAERLADQANR